MLVPILGEPSLNLIGSGNHGQKSRFEEVTDFCSGRAILGWEVHSQFVPRRKALGMLIYLNLSG